ncbi:hypothetical protein [Arthrobacter agilis]|uniref:hypothetical protein n=1 Tax=Arthrobacter agilis TaxID=37921 RepID=UPI0018646B10|nr:hypothetical protein [Arthrobacter agilis]
MTGPDDAIGPAGLTLPAAIPDGRPESPEGTGSTSMSAVGAGWSERVEDCAQVGTSVAAPPPGV